MQAYIFRSPWTNLLISLLEKFPRSNTTIASRKRWKDPGPFDEFWYAVNEILFGIISSVHKRSMMKSTWTEWCRKRLKIAELQNNIWCHLLSTFAAGLAQFAKPFSYFGTLSFHTQKEKTSSHTDFSRPSYFSSADIDMAVFAEINLLLSSISIKLESAQYLMTLIVTWMVIICVIYNTGVYRIHCIY